jgi:PAS domain S-box-containing protein
MNDKGQAEQALRTKAEVVARTRAEEQTATPVEMSAEEFRRLLHELRVHQIELEMQNTELRLTRDELEAQRTRYFDLYDLAPVGYCTVSEAGLLLEANLAAINLLGVTRAMLIGQRMSRFIVEEDQDGYYLFRKNLFASGQPQSCELRMVRKDGTLFSAHLAAALAGGASGIPVCRIVVSDISERKRAEEALKSALTEKEVLLREVHHRVKNNMAAIIGLFDLQQQAIDDPQAKTALQDLSSRVRAMSLVHEKLIHSESLSRIDFQDYIESLVSYLSSSFYREGIHFENAAQGVEVPLDLAVPCGMIINELIINAYKYAFPEERLKPEQEVDRIQVTMSHEGGTFSLSVADNGVGLPSGFDLQTIETLGLTLVRMLGEHQLGGRYEIDQTCGTRFTLTFSLRKEEESR